MVITKMFTLTFLLFFFNRIPILSYKVFPVAIDSGMNHRWLLCVCVFIDILFLSKFNTRQNARHYRDGHFQLNRSTRSYV